jgi:UDP-glucose-4-epimerase GalE
MRILVTGGAGYIGSHIVRLLPTRGHDVWVYDNLSYGHRAAVPSERLIVADLADRETLQKSLRDQRIDAIIHLAALAYVGESVTDPARYYQNNVIGSLQLLEAIREIGIQRLVFSSSCATYGVPERLPITESTPQKPVNPYGFTKLTIETALADYSRAYGIGYIALRYFNAAGASLDGVLGEDHRPETHLIPLVLQTALGLRPYVKIYGMDYPTPDGTCIRDYIHVEDLALAHLLALEHIQPRKAEAFNVGTGRGHSVREVIEAARRVTGRRIAEVQRPRRPGDPPELIAASQKIGKCLGWRPAFSDLDQIIETAWNWHRAHPDGYGQMGSTRAIAVA